MTKNNGFFKGQTETRLAGIEKRLDELHAETKWQTAQLNTINRKLSYLYGFSGGIGVVAGFVSSWISTRLS